MLIVKFLAKKNQWMSAGRAVRTLGGVALGQNKSIQIVKIGDALYIVGVGNNIQLLEKIADTEAVEQLIRQIQTNPGPVKLPSAGEWLGRLRRGGQSREAEEVDLDSSFQQVLLDKMNTLSDRKKRVADLLKDEHNQDRKNDNYDK